MLDLSVLGLTPGGASSNPNGGRTARLTNGTLQAMFVECPQKVCRQKQRNAKGAAQRHVTTACKPKARQEGGHPSR